MEVKQEYTIVKTHIYDTCHYTNVTINKKTNEYEFERNSYYFVDYLVRFDSVDRAMEVAKKITKEGTIINVVENYEEMNNIVYLSGNKYMDCYFILRVPKSFYLGKNWEKTLDYINETRYSDDKPCQLYASDPFYKGKDLWLVYNNVNDYSWVEDRFQATFFTDKECKEVQDIINKIKNNNPYGGYVRQDVLPLRPKEGDEPIFDKDEEVYMLGYEYIPNYLRYPIYRGNVTDFKVIRNEKGENEIVYYVDGSPYVDKYTKRDRLFTKKQLIEMGGKFYRGMHRGNDNTELFSFNEKTYVIY